MHSCAHVLVWYWDALPWLLALCDSTWSKYSFPNAPGFCGKLRVLLLPAALHHYFDINPPCQLGTVPGYWDIFARSSSFQNAIVALLDFASLSFLKKPRTLLCLATMVAQWASALSKHVMTFPPCLTIYSWHHTGFLCTPLSIFWLHSNDYVCGSQLHWAGTESQLKNVLHICVQGNTMQTQSPDKMQCITGILKQRFPIAKYCRPPVLQKPIQGPPPSEKVDISKVVFLCEWCDGPPGLVMGTPWSPWTTNWEPLWFLGWLYCDRDDFVYC